MPLNGRPLRALEIASSLGCETIQLFASNPTGWMPPTGGEEAALEFAQAARARGLAPLVVHAPYLINLASPREEVWRPSIRLLSWTLQRAALLGASDVVVHIGSHRGAGIELGIARLKEALGLVLAEAPSGAGPDLLARLRPGLDRLPGTGARSTVLPDGDCWLVVAPVRAAGVSFGFLCLGREAQPGSEDVVAVEQAATVCALLLARQEAAVAATRRLQSEFIWDLLEGRIPDEAEALVRARHLDHRF